MKKVIALIIFCLSTSAFALDTGTKTLLGSLLIYTLHKEINDQPRVINYHPAKMQQEIVTIITDQMPQRNKNQYREQYNCIVQVYDPVSNHYRNEAMLCVR